MKKFTVTSEVMELDEFERELAIKNIRNTLIKVTKEIEKKREVENNEKIYKKSNKKL